MFGDRPEVVVPVIHLNGTPKEDLLTQLDDAYRAIDDALVTLAKSAPNGRDYYPAEAGRFERAVEQHRQRMKALTGVMDSLEAECEAIEVPR